MRSSRAATALMLALYVGLGLAFALAWDAWRWHVGAAVQSAGDLAFLAYMAGGGPYLFVRFLARRR